MPRRGNSIFLSELLVPKLVLGPQRLAQFPQYMQMGKPRLRKCMIWPRVMISSLKNQG